MRTSSRWTGTVCVTFSVTTYFLRRARARLTLGLADLKLLFGAGHSVIGGGSARVVTLRTITVRWVGVRVTLGEPRVRGLLGVVEPVVAVELRFFLLGQFSIGVERRASS